MSLRYSSAISGWGKIFGIPIFSLTNEQLEVLDFNKLIECVELDSRVAPVICKKIEGRTDTLIQLNKISEILSDFPDLIKKYNECVRRERKAEPFNRIYYIRWELLDDENKEIEVLRLAENKSSMAPDNEVDYEWLNQRNPSLCDALIKRTIDRRHYYKIGLYHMLSSLPAEKVKPILKDIGIENVLVSPYANEEQTIKALRRLHKRYYLPPINVKLTAKIWSLLPPIMRLDLIESVMRHNNTVKSIVDNMSEEELRTLLFPSIVRYPRRVESVINRYKYWKGMYDERKKEA